MNEIMLPQKEKPRFALLGAGFHLCEFARLLVKKGFPKPIIVTHPKKEHERDRRLLRDLEIYKYVFDTAKDFDLEIIESNSANKESVLRLILDKKCNTAFSLSCRSIIKFEFLKAFEGRVFNIHPSLLPRERGGGTFSWRIMNDQKEVSATIHMIDEGIDTGPIVLQKKKELNMDRPLPADYLKKTNQVYVELLIEFLDMIQKSSTIKLKTQDESQATYLPRLHTESNAAIDWSWSANEIERFIRAFGNPYPGAYTFINNIRITIDDACVEPANMAFHPYANGRIISHLKDGAIRVIAKGGYLKINKVSKEGQSCVPSSFLKKTDMLSTPPEILYKAKTSIIPAFKMDVPIMSS